MIVWPQEVMDGAVPPEMSFRDAVAVTLVAWGNCQSGAGKIPKKFGEFMISFYKQFGISPTLENLTQEANKLLSDKETN